MSRYEPNQREFVTRTVLISGMILVILIFGTIIGVLSWPQRTIAKIERSIQNEDYEDAEELIEDYTDRYENADMSEYITVCHYYLAVEAIGNGDQDKAAYRLLQIDDYKDAKELLKECDYMDAMDELEDEAYDDAAALFTRLSDYKDSKDMLLLCKYHIAIRTYEAGDLGKALDLFLDLEDYEDSKDKADTIAMQVTGAVTIDVAYEILEGMNLSEMQGIAQLTKMRASLPTDMIAVGSHHTVGLKDDGTVLATGLNDSGQCDVGTWTDIIAVDAGAEHTIGLKSDGTVYAAGSNDEGQCNVDEWTDVIAIAASGYNTFALRTDGSILSTGFAEIDTSELKDIKQLGAGSYGAAFIDMDGVIFGTHPSLYVSDIDAIDVDVSTGYLCALMLNGTVVSTAGDTEQWENIVSMSAGANMILGVKADGSVAAYFFRQRDKVQLEYTDAIAVAAGGAHSVVVLSDGSVHAFGKDDYGQCDVSGWDLVSEPNE